MEDIDKASLRFYSWEARYRGYMLYPFPVSLEIPFTPYRPFIPSAPHDDGLVTRWWQKKKKSDVEEQEEVEWKCATEYHEKGERIALSLSFSGESESDIGLWEELLTLLSSYPRTFSFEVFGTKDDIQMQMTCLARDYPKLTSFLRAYFPSMVIREGDLLPHVFDGKGGDIAIIDFGLEYEFMLPIQTTKGREDPLLSMYALLDALGEGDCIMYQVLFSGVASPIARDTLRSLSDGQGGSFFPDETMLEKAEEKTSTPLFAGLVRVMCQGKNKRKSKMLANEMIATLEQLSDSGNNRLVALTNEGYSYRDHSQNVFKRATNRAGMILSSKELSMLAHVPERLSISGKLTPKHSKTKIAPTRVLMDGVFLGLNPHLNEANEVRLSVEDRLSHMHIMGATGMGKSTVIANLFLEDAKAGRSAIILDPHGDIVDDILVHIPENRREDVILFDPSDTEFPIGFNLLHAKTETEKIVLSSDIVATFKRYATSWGDRMTSVLSYAVDTFLSFDEPGTLLELKQFLVDKAYRSKKLEACTDQVLKAYWLYDFPHISRSSLTPLLMRFDTFLRSSIIRNMMAQTGGVDIASVMNGQKLLLVKLSQGLIGEDNARLLGTLIVTKIGQASLARQSISKEKRKPCFVYLDEFQHLLTPSIGSLVSGARKYGVGMTLVHQDFMQLEHEKALMHTTVSNTNVRMCFRLGYEDAQRMEKGFSYFERDDLLSLERGEAIMRVGGANNDFNITSSPLPPLVDSPGDVINRVQGQSREQFAQRKEDVEAIVSELFVRGNEVVESPDPKEPLIPEKPQLELTKERVDIAKNQLKEIGKQERKERRHEYLKTFVKKMGGDFGFRGVIEEPTENGGRVDVALHHDDISIACEISIGNSPEYEVKNIEKCLASGYDTILMIAEDEDHLAKIDKHFKESHSKSKTTVSFILVDSLSAKLQDLIPKKEEETKIKGYRVKVSYSQSDSQNDAEKRIAGTLLNRLKNRDKK